MKKRIAILSANIVDHRLLLNANESINGLKPGEQLLVDSDQYYFIYLMENNEEYTYIVLSEQIWPSLRSALEQKLPVWLTYQDEKKELTYFLEELEYVLSNIKDNSNYGEELLTKVAEIF
ncbi:MAG TPA: hypothetical protein VGI04_10020 [Neobacillus sp.]|jgi:hypothetical protein